MDERPGTPPSDAWQPHEPGAPAAPASGSGAPAAGAPGHGAPGHGASSPGAARNAPASGVPGVWPPAPGVPGPGTADWSTPTTAGWPSYGPDVAAAGRPDTGVPRRRRILAGAALATDLAVGGAGVAAAV